MKKPPPLKPFKCWVFSNYPDRRKQVTRFRGDAESFSVTGSALIPCMCVPIKPKKKRSKPCPK